MKIGFTGTQKGMTEGQKNALRKRLRELGAICVVHGGCIGADNDADIIAAELGLFRWVLPSENAEKSAVNEIRERRPEFVRVFPAAPPLVRNREIVKLAERLLAAPSGPVERLRSGTWATVRAGRKRLGEGRVELLLEGL